MELLSAAAAGDEQAFVELTAPLRRRLHAHCYRMLGSVHDAEDALQEVSLRAWRGLERFEGRSSLKSWLYTIATNTCLNQIERRPKRVLPVDYAPAADPATRLQPEIGALAGRDPLGPPSAEPRVEAQRPLLVTGVQLEMDEGPRGVAAHVL